MKPAADLALIEDLDRNILTLCTHINAATYELLVLIREFDERAGWLKWGLKNRAEWLAWRCERRSGPRPRQMMTFLAACRLPLRLAAWGPLLQVRALTRVASRASEDGLLVFALRSTAAHVAERCRELPSSGTEVRCGSEDSIDGGTCLCQTILACSS